MGELRDAATNNPIVQLLASSIDGDVRTTTVRGEVPDYAVAPASLIDPTSRHVALELHRLVANSASEMTFETYGTTVEPPRGRYVLQGWWMPPAHDLVADRGRVWVKAALPDRAPHFCLLTYEQLEPGNDAYTDGRGSWISVKGYRTFIQQDRLRLRDQRGSG